MTASTLTIDAFLCDSIEGVGGKLYALGIGWNGIGATQFPARHPRFGVGLVIHVPYTATNQQHEFFVHIENQDGATLPLGQGGPGTDPRALNDDGQLVRLGGAFNLGRPAELPHGDEQVVALALQFDQVEFPQDGLYAAVVTADKMELTRLSFRVRLIQQLQIPLPG